MYNEMYLNYILTLLDQTISSIEKKEFLVNIGGLYRVFSFQKD